MWFSEKISVETVTKEENRNKQETKLEASRTFLELEKKHIMICVGPTHFRMFNDISKSARAMHVLTNINCNHNIYNLSNHSKHNYTFHPLNICFAIGNYRNYDSYTF
jgi:hypothetical protein